jgi:hypothetical protein
VQRRWINLRLKIDSSCIIERENVESHTLVSTLMIEWTNFGFESWILCSQSYYLYLNLFQDLHILFWINCIKTCMRKKKNRTMLNQAKYPSRKIHERISLVSSALSLGLVALRNSRLYLSFTDQYYIHLHRWQLISFLFFLFDEKLFLNW